MNESLSLFDSQDEYHEIFNDLAPHIVKKFFAFHRKNPEIYGLFVRFTDELVNSGRKRYGTKSIAERIRWHVAVETRDVDFKISNDYPSCYARLLILDKPKLKSFFHLRGSVTPPKKY